MKSIRIDTHETERGEITTYELVNASGASVKLSSLGAGIIEIKVPDRFGNLDDVVLGYKDLNDYFFDGPCAGKIPGRFAKKIPGLSRIENAIDDLLAELNVDISADAKIIIKKYDKNDPVTLIDVEVIIPASTATASDGTTVNIDAQTVTATVPVADALNDLIDGLNGDLAEVNDLLDQIQKFSNLGTKLSDKIGGYFDRANNYYAKLVNAFNTKALEPTLLMIDNDQYKRVRRGVDAGKIELVPTTWTSELLAPAYAKFVAVVAIDGEPATAADNEGNLGEILYGNEKVYLNVEAGKTYKIAYSAVDFFGVTRTHYYTIKGK